MKCSVYFRACVSAFDVTVLSAKVTTLSASVCVCLLLTSLRSRPVYVGRSTGHWPVYGPPSWDRWPHIDDMLCPRRWPLVWEGDTRHAQPGHAQTLTRSGHVSRKRRRPQQQQVDVFSANGANETSPKRARQATLALFSSCRTSLSWFMRRRTKRRRRTRRQRRRNASFNCCRCWQF